MGISRSCEGWGWAGEVVEGGEDMLRLCRAGERSGKRVWWINLPDEFINERGEAQLPTNNSAPRMRC